MRVAIVAIIVPALCMAAQAQEAKPCPSGHICPICTEQDGVRSCKVERPGQQPELPQAAAPLDISPPSRPAWHLPPLLAAFRKDTKRASQARRPAPHATGANFTTTTRQNVPAPAAPQGCGLRAGGLVVRGDAAAICPRKSICCC